MRICIVCNWHTKKNKNNFNQSRGILRAVRYLYVTAIKSNAYPKYLVNSFVHELML